MITEKEMEYYNHQIIPKLATALVKKEELEIEDLTEQDFIDCCKALALKDEHKERLLFFAGELSGMYKNNKSFKSNVYCVALDILTVKTQYNNPNKDKVKEIISQISALSVLGRIYFHLNNLKNEI